MVELISLGWSEIFS